jgi:hypothetical protein
MELQFLEIVKILAVFSTLMLLKYESSIKVKHISRHCYISVSLSREHIPHSSALCSLNVFTTENGRYLAAILSKLVIFRTKI